MSGKVEHYSLYPIDDMAPFMFELSWEDVDGEAWSEEYQTLDEVFERIRDLDANGSP